MPAMSAPEPSPSKMNSRICSTGHSLRVSGGVPGYGCGVADAAAAGQSRGRGAAEPVQDGGWIQPDILTQPGRPLVTPPMYSKSWMRSLQTAGALEYLAQASEGAPSACGPVNAFAFARMADGDRLA